MNKLVVEAVRRTLKRDLAVLLESDCAGCREQAVARASILMDALLHMATRDNDTQPVPVQSGNRFVARYTFIQLPEEGA